MQQSFNSADNGDLHLQYGEYSGPIDLLLKLINDSKMSIMEIKLSSLTDAFLDYVQSAQYVSLAQQSDFLMVASDMLRIKSAALLPSDANEEYIEEQQFEAASTELKLKEIAIRQDYMLTIKSAITPLEALGRAYREPESYSEKELKVVVRDFNFDKLIEAYVKVMHRVVLMEQNVDTKQVEKESFSVASQVEFIKNRLISEKSISLYSTFDGCIGRSELICTFLAILELAKRQFCFLNQSERNGDIFITLFDSSVDTDGGIDEYK